MSETQPPAQQSPAEVPPDEQVAPTAPPAQADPELQRAVASNPANQQTDAQRAAADERAAQLERENEALRARLDDMAAQIANPAAASATGKRAERQYVVPAGVHHWDALMAHFDEHVRNADDAPNDVGDSAHLFTVNRDRLDAAAAARGFRLQYVYDEPSNDPRVPGKPTIGYHVFPGEHIVY